MQTVTYFVQPTSPKVVDLLLARLKDTNFELGRTSSLAVLEHGTLQPKCLVIAVESLGAAKLESFLRNRQSNSDPSVKFFSRDIAEFLRETGAIKPEVAAELPALLAARL